MVAIQLLGLFMCCTALLLLGLLLPLFISWFDAPVPQERQTRWMVAFTTNGIYIGHEAYCYA